MIAIVDYGRGNLGIVEKAFERVGVPAVVTQDPRAVDEADAVVLPGDGAFHDAMASLAALGLLEPLRRALDGRRPFLGHLPRLPAAVLRAARSSARGAGST